LNCEKKQITEKQKTAIEKALQKGDRVELIPVKDGIKIMHVRKNELKTE
jgi:hypothetical protein